jgi:hypothetical protein
VLYVGTYVRFELRHPIVLSFNYYVSVQSTQLRIYRSMHETIYSITCLVMLNVNLRSNLCPRLLPKLSTGLRPT